MIAVRKTLGKGILNQLLLELFPSGSGNPELCNAKQASKQDEEPWAEPIHGRVAPIWQLELFLKSKQLYSSFLLSNKEDMHV